MFRPGDKIGPYSLIQKIGRGASGEVWLSERRTIIGVSTQVALKIIPLQDEMELATIKQEANLWERANGHPNVVSITEADIYDGYVVITSEYVQDGSLADWLNRHGRKELDIQTAVNIVSGILNGLAHLHAQNIVHRDIKPANILMDGNTPRVTDFGVSRLFSSTIQSNHISGTTAYMSPEALEGWYSPQVDVWSAGVILYRLLVGYLPFQGPTDQAVMYKISHGKPAVIPSSITAQLGEIITCSLQRDLERRYKSAAEMRQALIEVSSRLNVSTSRQTNLPTITDPSSSSSISATGLDADELDDHTREATRAAFEVATDISLELRAAGMEVRHRSEELRQCVEANCAERSSVEAELAVRAVIPPAQAEKDAATTPDEKVPESVLTLVHPAARSEPTWRAIMVSVTCIILVGVLVATLVMWRTLKPLFKTQPTANERQAGRPPTVRPKTITNRLGMEFVWVQPGSFTMGSSDDDVRKAERSPPGPL